MGGGGSFALNAELPHDWTGPNTKVLLLVHRETSRWADVFDLEGRASCDTCALDPVLPISTLMVGTFIIAIRLAHLCQDTLVFA